MAVTSTPIFPQVVTSTFQQILPATASALVVLLTPGVNGSRVDNISITSTDTTDRSVQLYVTSGGTDYLIATISVPQASGNTNNVYAVAAFQGLAFQGFNYDPNGNRYIYLSSGSVLKAKSTTTVTAAKVIQFIVQGGDY